MTRYRDRRHRWDNGADEYRPGGYARVFTCTACGRVDVEGGPLLVPGEFVDRLLGLFAGVNPYRSLFSR